MSSPSFDIAQLIHDKGIAELGKDLFATREIPPKPDKLTMVINSGTYDEPSANLIYRYPMVQVVARGAAGEFSECTDRIYEIDIMLHGLTGVIVNGNRYVYIYRNTEPMDLDYDETMRPFIGANYRMNMTYGYLPDQGVIYE